MRNLRLFLCLSMILILSACNGDNESLPESQPRSTTAPLDSNQSTAVPFVTRVVTLAPSPTIQPTASPTLAFDVLPIEGAWTLLINYNITDENMVGTVHYSSSAQLLISASGAVAGSGSFKKYVEYPECPVEVKNETQDFTLDAELIPAGDGQTARLQITIVPEQPDELESFSIRCFQGDTQTDRPVDALILWPALEANELLTFTFDMTQDFYSETFEYEGLTGDIYFGR
ncbi:MAG: hypothetical protein K8I82_03335 [Anaerolineae bacterium]|nr:hypothetical protein [Anaerolineae bacterium]